MDRSSPAPDELIRVVAELTNKEDQETSDAATNALRSMIFTRQDVEGQIKAVKQLAALAPTTKSTRAVLEELRQFTPIRQLADQIDTILTSL